MASDEMAAAAADDEGRRGTKEPKRGMSDGVGRILAVCMGTDGVGRGGHGMRKVRS